MRISDWSSDVCSSDLICSDQMWMRESSPPDEASGGWGNRQATASSSMPSLSQRFTGTSQKLSIGLPPMLSKARVDPAIFATACVRRNERSEEHTSDLQSLMRISYAVFCLKKKINE